MSAFQHFIITSFQPLSVPACQYVLCTSAFQHYSIPVFMHSSIRSEISAFQHVSMSAFQRSSILAFQHTDTPKFQHIIPVYSCIPACQNGSIPSFSHSSMSKRSYSSMSAFTHTMSPSFQYSIIPVSGALQHTMAISRTASHNFRVAGCCMTHSSISAFHNSKC